MIDARPIYPPPAYGRPRRRLGVIWVAALFYAAGAVTAFAYCQLPA